MTEIVPLKTQPLNILFNGLNIFLIGGAWVRVIKAEIALTTVGFFESKIKTNGFGVSNVQIPVGFGGKRVWTRPEYLPSLRSLSMIFSIKFFTGFIIL